MSVSEHQTGTTMPWRQMIPVERIHPNTDNPRKEPGDLESLEAAIREQGLKQPVLLRPYPGMDGHYILHDGWRRWLAMKEWNSAIPAIIQPPRPGENMHVSAILTGLVTSVHQQPLNPIERANAYLDLKTKFGMDDKAIAQATGLTVSTISDTLVLCELSPDTQKKVAEGKIGVGEAKRLVRMQRKRERARRRPGSSGRMGAVWAPLWLTSTHALAIPAQTRCNKMDHNNRRRLGAKGTYQGACGQCWDHVIGSFAEADLYERLADEIHKSDPARAASWRQIAKTLRDNP